MGRVLRGGGVPHRPGLSHAVILVALKPRRSESAPPAGRPCQQAGAPLPRNCRGQPADLFEQALGLRFLPHPSEPPGLRDLEHGGRDDEAIAPLFEVVQGVSG